MKLFKQSHHSYYLTTILSETQNDPVLINLAQTLKSNNRNLEFTLHKNIILRRNRVYIPSTLRITVLQELHSTHIGVEKMKMLARSTTRLLA